MSSLNDLDVRDAYSGKYLLDGRPLQCGSELVVQVNGTWLVGRVEHEIDHGYYWICTFRGGAGTPLTFRFALAELALKRVEVR